MTSIAVLAYGSLIDEPGTELSPLVTRRIKRVKTPFCIEFARSSSTRDGAPTLVPVAVGGAPVYGVLLVLENTVDRAKAEDLLWRRETRNEGTGKSYPRPPMLGPNKVIIECRFNFAEVEIVLFTKIATNIDRLTPDHLADLAIGSARRGAGAKQMDGISYLISAINNGMSTPLLPKFKDSILEKTGAASLEDAYSLIRSSVSQQSTS